MSLERRFFFPVARFIFCIAAVASMVGLLYTWMVALGAWQESKTASVRVTRDAVYAQLKPFGSSPPKGDPFGRVVLPDKKLASSFPDANIAGLLDLLGRDQPVIQNIAKCIDDAEGRGDKAREYVENAIEILQGVADAAMRPTAFDVYHRERLRQVPLMQAARSAASAKTQLMAISAAALFMGFLQITLILAVFAVERNTRSPQP